MLNARISKFRPTAPLNIKVPGSKSITNRALIMAAMAKGKSCLFGVLDSDDSYHCIETLKKLGVIIHKRDETTLEIISPGLEGLQSEEALYIGSAGTIARFLPGLLAASRTNGHYKLEASEQLQNRPLQTLLENLEKLGAQIKYDSQMHRLPFTVVGRTIVGGEIEMPGDVSSQFISGMLMAAPYFTQGLRLKTTTPIVQAQYVQITIEMMRSFGVEVEVDDNNTHFYVAPQQYQPQNYTIEADVSTAGYFFAMAPLLNTTVHVNVNRQTTQPDIELLNILQLMGATVVWGAHGVTVKSNGIVRGGQKIDLSACSDQALTVAVLSVFADKPVHLYGIGHIRYHESNRLQVLQDNLRRLGIQTDLFQDGITIYPGAVKQNVELLTYDDHRIAMAFSLLALKAGDITICDALCTKKTFPQYFQYLQEFGAKILLIEENENARS